MRAYVFIGVLAISGCVLQTVNSPMPMPQTPPTLLTAPGSKLSDAQALNNYRAVKARMEPYVERACREISDHLNCDFRIVVDERENLPPNAFQTLEDSGRPVLGFTMALLKDVRNQDELAFVFAHEAAHHIRGHLTRKRNHAIVGNVVGGVFAVVLGAGADGIDVAQDIGTSIGARSYSKNFELEADELGAILTEGAGYDAVKGAAYFLRIPDPGNIFLGTHPPNANRINTIRQAVGR